MKRWYDDKDEAIEVARNSGYFCWRVRKMVKVRRGMYWSYGRRPVGSPRWYVALELPKSMRTGKWEYIEEIKSEMMG